jgi:integral membrane protein (TIGR01906 family)
MADKNGASVDRARPSRILGFVLTVLTVLWLVAASFMVVLTPPVTHQLAEATVDTADSTQGHDYLVQMADATRAYCVGGSAASLPQGPDDRTQYTPSVMQHLSDVRGVFIGAQVFAAVVTVLLAVALIVRARKSGRRSLGRALEVGGVVAVVLVAMLFAAGAANFDALFTMVHEIFFKAGSWLFNADSLLICALPQPFWMGCGIVWAVALAVLCAASVIVGHLLLRPAKK